MCHDNGGRFPIISVITGQWVCVKTVVVASQLCLSSLANGYVSRQWWSLPNYFCHHWPMVMCHDIGGRFPIISVITGQWLCVTTVVVASQLFLLLLANGHVSRHWWSLPNYFCHHWPMVMCHDSGSHFGALKYVPLSREGIFKCTEAHLRSTGVWKHTVPIKILIYVIKGCKWSYH